MHVTADDAPTLLVHGDKDELCSYLHSQKIITAFLRSKVPAELITIEVPRARLLMQKAINVW